MRILVTGGSGFIGSALVRRLIGETEHRVLNLDKLTYAANPASLAAVAGHPRYAFRRVDLCEGEAVATAVCEFRPDGLIHLAAESHVDRSIVGPEVFLRTNVGGTHALLEAIRRYLAESGGGNGGFRLLHVSTDEVYGDLGEGDPPVAEGAAYAPHSPYAASKAASDHLVRAWAHTYGIPAIITQSSNTYGPRQFPEKLVPHMILRAISGKTLPVYGDGRQIRDWLHVEDHVDALLAVFGRGRIGESYHLGGGCERRNLALVESLAGWLDELASDRRPGGVASFRDRIERVADRPGHDRRYALDTAKIRAELGWRPTRPLDEGLGETVRWYLDHPDWWRAILSGDYRLERPR